MIPPSEEYGMPGAADPAIFADIVRSLGRDTNDVRAALAALGQGFAELDAAQAEAAANAVLGRGDRVAAALGRAVLQCYYRDDRVLTALGLEARAPYPKGHVVEQGDWSCWTRCVAARHCGAMIGGLDYEPPMKSSTC